MNTATSVEPARRTTDVRIEMAGAAAGVASTVLVMTGLLLIIDFIPPRDPSADAAQIVEFYTGSTDRIRTSMIVTMIGFSLFAPFGVALATILRGAEQRPVLTYLQICSVSIATLLAIGTTFIWSTAAFRPAEIDPETLRMLNDLGWFCFLFTIPPFTIWIAAVGVAILTDRRDTPALPRWTGYLNLWVSVFILPGMMMTYFKTGPFAFDGIIALYLPFGAFFVWILAMSPAMFASIRRGPTT